MSDDMSSETLGLGVSDEGTAEEVAERIQFARDMEATYAAQDAADEATREAASLEP